MGKNKISLFSRDHRVIYLYQPYALLHVHIIEKEGRQMLISSSDIFKLVEDFANNKNWETESDMRPFLIQKDK